MSMNGYRYVPLLFARSFIVRKVAIRKSTQKFSFNVISIPSRQFQNTRDENWTSNNQFIIDDKEENEIEDHLDITNDHENIEINQSVSQSSASFKMDEDNEDQLLKEIEREIQLTTNFIGGTRKQKKKVKPLNKVLKEIAISPNVDLLHGLRERTREGLENVEKRQILALQKDANQVCHNCGERGHIERNCLLPTICSYCGNVGHREEDCKHKRREKTFSNSTKNTKIDPEDPEHLRKLLSIEVDEYLESMDQRRRRKKKKQTEQTQNNIS